MKITINIEAVFGSDFQQELGLRSLILMLDAWEIHMKQAHKKNQTIITINAEDNKKRPESKETK